MEPGPQQVLLPRGKNVVLILRTGGPIRQFGIGDSWALCKALAVCIMKIPELEPTSLGAWGYRTPHPRQVPEHPLSGWCSHEVGGSAPSCDQRLPTSSTAHALSSFPLLESVMSRTPFPVMAYAPWTHRVDLMSRGYCQLDGVCGRQHKMKDNMCASYSRDGCCKLMPLRHQQKGQAPEPLEINGSTFMGVQGLQRRQCVLLTWLDL